MFSGMDPPFFMASCGGIACGRLAAIIPKKKLLKVCILFTNQSNFVLVYVYIYMLYVYIYIIYILCILYIFICTNMIAHTHILQYVYIYIYICIYIYTCILYYIYIQSSTIWFDPSDDHPKMQGHTTSHTLEREQLFPQKGNKWNVCRQKSQIENSEPLKFVPAMFFWEIIMILDATEAFRDVQLNMFGLLTQG